MKNCGLIILAILTLFVNDAKSQERPLAPLKVYLTNDSRSQAYANLRATYDALIGQQSGFVPNAPLSFPYSAENSTVMEVSEISRNQSSGIPAVLMKGTIGARPVTLMVEMPAHDPSPLIGYLNHLQKIDQTTSLVLSSSQSALELSRMSEGNTGLFARNQLHIQTGQGSWVYFSGVDLPEFLQTWTRWRDLPGIRQQNNAARAMHLSRYLPQKEGHGSTCFLPPAT